MQHYHSIDYKGCESGYPYTITCLKGCIRSGSGNPSLDTTCTEAADQTGAEAWLADS